MVANIWNYDIRVNGRRDEKVDKFNHPIKTDNITNLVQLHRYGRNFVSIDSDTSFDQFWGSGDYESGDTLTSDYTDIISPSNTVTYGSDINFVKVIDTAIYELLYAGRADAKKHFILVAASEHDVEDYGELPICDKLKALGITVTIVKLGNSADVFTDNSGLKSLASEPHSKHYIPIDNVQSATADYDQYDNIGPILANLRAAIAPFENDVATSCSIVGDNRVSTFDGQVQSIGGAGEFYLTAPCEGGDDYSADKLSAQVRFEPCEYESTEDARVGSTIPSTPASGRVCARAFALKMETHEVELVWEPKTSQLNVRFDGTWFKRTFFQGEYSTECSQNVDISNVIIKMNPLHFGGFEVTVFHTVHGHFVKVRFDHSEVGASAYIRPGMANLVAAGSSVGLCGKYDMCKNNDLTTREDSIINEDDSDASKHYNFVDSWRVPEADSLFESEGNYQYEEFVPTFAKLDSSNSKAGLAACAGLPDGPDAESSFLDMCARDYDVTGDASVFEGYLFIYKQTCQVYCLNGVFENAILARAFAENGDICAPVCAFSRASSSFSVDYDALHSTELPSVDIRGSDLPDAYFLFHSSSSLGGQYVFQRTIQRQDLCVEPNYTTTFDNETGDYDMRVEYEQFQEINSTLVTVDIACAPLPTVTALNPGITYFNNYGFTTVPLRAIINGDIESEAQNLVYSWKLTNYTYYNEFEAMDDEDLTIHFANSLWAEYRPVKAGLYEFSFAVTDGCAVSTSTVEIQAVEECCTPPVRIEPITNPSWNHRFEKFDFSISVAGTGVNGGFDMPGLPYAEDSGYCLVDSSATTYQYASGFTAPAHTIQTDRHVITRYEWTLDHRSETYGGAASTGVLGNAVYDSVEESYSYKYSVELQAEEILSNTTVEATERVSTTDTSVPFFPYSTNALTANEGPHTHIYSRLAAKFDLTGPVKTFVDEVVTNSTVVVLEEVAEKCYIQIEDVFSQSPNVEIFVNDTSGFHSEGSICQGFYTFNSKVNLVGMGDACANEYQSTVFASCGPVPFVEIQCDSKITYDYDAGRFDDITLETSYPSGIEDFKWVSVDGDEETFLYDEDDYEHVFTEPGTVSLKFYVGNKCVQNFAAVILEASCAAEDEPVADQSFSNTTETATDSSGVDFYVNGSASLNPIGDIVSGHVLVYNWNVVDYPMGADVWGEVYFNKYGSAPSFPTVVGEAATVPVTVPGTYTIQLTVDSGCVENSINQTYVYSCDTGFGVETQVNLTSTFNDTVTDDYDLVELFANITQDNTGFTETFFWNITSYPGASAPVITNDETDTASFTPNAIGQYVVALVASDGCNVIEREFTVVASCGVDPFDSADATIPFSWEDNNADGVDQGTGDKWIIDISNITAVGPEVTAVSAASLSPYLTWAAEGDAITDVAASVTRVADTFEIVFKNGISGVVTATITVTNECGKTTDLTVTSSAACPFTASATADQSTGTVAFTNGGFPRVELFGSSATFGGAFADDSGLDYIWVVTAAPNGSFYEPYNRTEIASVSTPVTSGPTTTPPLSTEIPIGANRTTVEGESFEVTWHESIGYTILNNEDVYAALTNPIFPDNDIDAFPACFVADIPGEYTIELMTRGNRVNYGQVFFDNQFCLSAAVNGEVSVTATCPAAIDPSALNIATSVDLSADIVGDVVLDATSLFGGDLNKDISIEWTVHSMTYNNSVYAIRNENGALATAVFETEGDYVLRITVNDGCNEEVTADFPIAVAYGNECTVFNETETGIVAPFNYLGRTSTPIILNGGDIVTSGAEGYSGQDNAIVSDAGSFPGYGPYSSKYNDFTISACDVVYSWSLVEYNRESVYEARNPCSGNSKLIVCGGSGVSKPAAKANPDPEFVAEADSPASFHSISMMVVAMFVVLSTMIQHLF